MRKEDLEHCLFSLPHGFRVMAAAGSLLAPCDVGESLEFEG
jgi:hypothetical protein